MSKPGIAPCGHPGTYVTNTFITCNFRCGFGDTRVPILANPRREPGHVDMCACAPCQIRRKSERLELTDHLGQKASLTWDGVRNRIDWTPGRSFKARHYSFRDVNGDEVASGIVHADLVAGRTAHIDIALFMDAVDRVRMTISQPGSCFRKFDPSKVLVSLGGIERKDCAPATFVVTDLQAIEAIKSGSRPVSIGGAYFDADAKAGEVVSVSWRAQTFDQIYADMKSFTAKSFGNEPDGGLYDQLLRVCAEQTAECYRLAELALFEV